MKDIKIKKPKNYWSDAVEGYLSGAAWLIVIILACVYKEWVKEYFAIILSLYVLGGIIAMVVVQFFKGSPKYSRGGGCNHIGYGSGAYSGASGDC